MKKIKAMFFMILIVAFANAQECCPTYDSIGLSENQCNVGFPFLSDEDKQKCNTVLTCLDQGLSFCENNESGDLLLDDNIIEAGENIEQQIETEEGTANIEIENEEDIGVNLEIELTTDEGITVNTEVETPPEANVIVNDDGSIVQTLEIQDGADVVLNIDPTGDAVIKLSTDDNTESFETPRGSQTFVDSSGEVVSASDFGDVVVVLNADPKTAKAKAVVNVGSKSFELSSYDGIKNRVIKYINKNTRSIFGSNFNAVESNFESNRLFVVEERVDDNVSIEPSADSSFSEVLTFDGRRTITLNSGSAFILNNGRSKEDMEIGKEYEINPKEVQKSNYPQFVSKDLTLMEGWNLLSIVNSNSINIDDIGNIEKVFTYQNGKWSSPNVLEPGVGYWLKVTKETVLSMDGNGTKFKSNDNIGWVLYGAGEKIDLNDIIDSDTDLFVYVNPKFGWIKKPDVIYPAQAFWVKQK